MPVDFIDTEHLGDRPDMMGHDATHVDRSVPLARQHPVVGASVGVVFFLVPPQHIVLIGRQDDFL